MARREFSKTVYAEIVKRALHPKHGICCEGCGLVLGSKPYHVDHTKPDGMEVDKSRKLTADDGKLLGVECCHAPKTKQDVADIAKAKRREARYLGMKKPAGKIKSPGFAKSPKPVREQQDLPRRSLYRSADANG